MESQSFSGRKHDPSEALAAGQELVASRQLPNQFAVVVPPMVAAAGEDVSRRFLEFFTANIRNENTRMAYARAVFAFCSWCEQRRLALPHLEPMIIAAYVEQLGTKHSPPTVKQHLAAIRMLFDWLVFGHIVRVNPASSVRGPNRLLNFSVG
jgi:integrase/recombinase XerD